MTTISPTLSFQEQAKEAFNKAILSGRLSSNPRADNYAGNYMFMGSSTQPGKQPKDAFKHILTRIYIK